MIQKYLSLVKFSHTIFGLPFALIGFTLALIDTQQPFSIKLFVLMLLCMVTARNAAMAFNRFLDRKFDALNPRTAVREIPAGVISPKGALMFTIINAVIFIAITYFINPLCFYLSPIAIFVILFYSYTKRITALCHIVLGIGLGLAPIGAYLAVTGVFSMIPVLFSFTVFCWVSGFDIIYALQDEEFDRGIKLHSIPAALGSVNALRVSVLLHIVAAILVIFAGYELSIQGKINEVIYGLGTLVFIGCLIYQHSIVKPNDLSRVGIAFGTTNGIASLIFAVFTIASLLIK